MIELNLPINEHKGERADAAANRLLLLETAERLFAQYGVAAVNMADIAEAAGVGKGTLYRRFPNKATLCLALMDTQMRTFQDEILARLRQMQMQRVPYLQQLGHFLEAFVLFADIHLPLLCEVQREGWLGDEGVDRPYIWRYLTVKGLLDAAARQQEISPDLDTAYLAEALLAPLHPALFHFQRSQRGYELDRISTGLRSLVESLGNS
ncbi:MAG: TetR/AcrR family transcriptional regulator [Anaerolineae bacterium]|nr:TetR/AcrR family transcriptional regulator [Anaerolineae bacterium]